MELITQSNVMFILGLLGIAYSVFMAFFKPQAESRTNDLLIDQKANFLREENDKKFVALDQKFADLTKDNQNHLHTIESKLDSVMNMQIQQGKEMVELKTIINIKLPK